MTGLLISTEIDWFWNISAAAERIEPLPMLEDDRMELLRIGSGILLLRRPSSLSNVRTRDVEQSPIDDALRNDSFFDLFLTRILEDSNDLIDFLERPDSNDFREAED